MANLTPDDMANKRRTI